MRLCRIAAFVVILASAPARSQSPDPAESRTAEQSTGRKKYAPGVYIDWDRRRVELDAHVALREGNLELFACAPRSKEHESIVVTHGRPLHIFQALGLIGLESGTPPRYDSTTGETRPAGGAAVSILVRTQDRPAVPIESWMVDVARERPMPSADWVFAGSFQSESGRFGADVEGTVISVVDFPTSLICVADTHTSDDAALWLKARTEAIPPRDTPCTLLIQDADQTILQLKLLDDGQCEVEGRSEREGRRLTLEQFDEYLADRIRDERLSRIEVSGDREPPAVWKSFRETIAKSQFPEECVISVRNASP